MDNKKRTPEQQQSTRDCLLIWNTIANTCSLAVLLMIWVAVY